MIHKASEYKNGYIFGPSSTDKDFQEILKSYSKVNCIICNEKTRKNFRVGMFTNPMITINNKLTDGVFFINGTF